MWSVAIAGVAVLVVLATLIGTALDRQARADAWNRIAATRRINAENRRADEEKAVELQVREAELDLRERRTEFREEQLFRREAAVEELERRRPGPPARSA